MAPPGEVQVKVAVKMNWMVIPSEGCQKIDHPMLKRVAQRDHFASMVQMTNK